MTSFTDQLSTTEHASRAYGVSFQTHTQQEVTARVSDAIPVPMPYTLFRGR